MNLELSILRVLSDLQPLMLREKTLLAEVVTDTDGEATHAVILLSLRKLERLNQVVGAPHEGSHKWKITAEGIARLAEA